MGFRAFLLSAFVLESLLCVFGVREAAALEVARFGDAGFLRVDYQLQGRAGVRDQGPDPSKDENTYNVYVRRNRLSLIGAGNEMFGGVVQLELNGGQKLGDTSTRAEARSYEFTVLDVFATANFTDYLKLRLGKTKHVLTREVQEGCFDPLSIDRSPFILGPFTQSADWKTTRDWGLVAWGNAWNDRVQYRAAFMQGNPTGPEGIGFRYTARVHLTFFDKETGIVYRGTYLGKKRVLTLGAGYELQPNAVHSTETTALDGSEVYGGAENYQAYTIDAFYEHPTQFGTFTISSAFLVADFGGAAARGVTDAQGVTGERNGYFWKAAYMLSDFQVYGRYERWSFANLNGVLDQQLHWWVGGLNYYIKGQALRLTLEYEKTILDRPPASNFDTVLLQVQAQI